MNAEIKCESCGKWSKWNQKLDDTCDHCGALLKEKDLERAELTKKNKQKELDEWVFTIKETDSGFVKVMKKVGNVIYLIYMGILGFIAWLVAALPG